MRRLSGDDCLKIFIELLPFKIGYHNFVSAISRELQQVEALNFISL